MAAKEQIGISEIIVKIIIIVLIIICLIYAVEFFITSNVMLQNDTISHYRSGESLYLSMKTRAKWEIFAFFTICLIFSFFVARFSKRYLYLLFYLVPLAFIAHTILIFEWIYGGVRTPMNQCLYGTIMALLFIFFSVIVLAGCVLVFTYSFKKIKKS